MKLIEMAKHNPMLCRAQTEEGELIYGRSAYGSSIEQPDGLGRLIDPDTLQPWTSAYDKNELPIFLGDILECPASRHGNNPSWYNDRNQYHGNFGTVFLEVARPALGCYGFTGYGLIPLPSITKKQLDFIALPVGKESKNQIASYSSTHVQKGVVIANNTEPNAKLLRLYDEWVERTEAWRISTLTY